MEHLDVQLAHRLLNGQLDPATQAHWLQHADRCLGCHDLLANERALMAVLDLGQGPSRAPGARSLDRLLERVDQLAPGAPARRWSRNVLAIIAATAVVGLSLLLTWQLSRASAEPAAIAQELRITADLQNKVVANLDTLGSLADDPWLLDQYEAVCTLEQLVTGQSLQ